MKVLILRSSFQSDDFVRTEYGVLLDLLKNRCNAEITILGDENVETFPETSPQLQSVDFIMVATGGVENLFKTIWSTGALKATTLIADGRNNSLAASLEILTYLTEHGQKGRIIHGTNEEIINDIVETFPETSHPETSHPVTSPHTDLFNGTRIGVFGQPSDWLIASGVDYDYLREHFGITTVFIDLKRLVDEIGKDARPCVSTDMLAADKTYSAIKKICQEERLDAMTIRCFDIVKACNTTSCLALARLNDEGIVAGCEGDMQTLMTMLLAKKLCNEPAFMANPSILTDKTSMFAHCTVPLSMCYKTSMRTHFESGIGVAVQGDLPLGDYTILKWGGRKLDKFFVTEAKAIKNEYSNHFCRTQITFDVNLKPYLLKHPIGNHHVIIKGRHADEITSFLAFRRP